VTPAHRPAVRPAPAAARGPVGIERRPQTTTTSALHEAVRNDPAPRDEFPGLGRR
jgi:hypothetical protein